MRMRSQLLSIVFVSATMPFVSVGAAQASEMCTVKTAKQSVSSKALCACDVVSSRMVRYIQRRADFEAILEQTLLDCPAFAAILTDLPTASIGFAEQRSGDGPDDETAGSNEPPDSDTPSDPDPSDPEPKDPDPDPKGPPADDDDDDDDPKKDPPATTTTPPKK